MGAEIIGEENGCVTAKISGKLTHPELAVAQKALAAILRTKGKLRLLVLTENFQGWEKSGDWEDMSFMNESDPFIDRMAIVGEEQWKGLVYMFTGKGFRRCLVEYFSPADAAKAKSWLMEKA